MLADAASSLALADVEVREVRRLLCCFALGLAFAFALGMPPAAGGVLVLTLVRCGNAVPSCPPVRSLSASRLVPPAILKTQSPAKIKKKRRRSRTHMPESETFSEEPLHRAPVLVPWLL